MSTPQPAALTEGTLLGKYRLEKLLGEGGMGAVWVAQNVDVGRRVAVKVLKQALAADPEMLARFRNEARAAAAIGHPGIVDVYDLGVDLSGASFIVMELLVGETLASRLTRAGPMPVAAVVSVARSAASAIAAAHEAGIVHRDLKPDNLFLVEPTAEKPGPAVKILDFGIARFRRGEDLALTRTGVVMGTPLYMSPEQARGAKELTAATDLYSFGAILFHCLGGLPPFVGDSYNEVLAKVLTEQHRPAATLRPDVPPRLASLIDALLSKDAAARPPSMKAVLEALDHLEAAGAGDLGSTRASSPGTLRPAAAGPVLNTVLPPKSEPVLATVPVPQPQPPAVGGAVPPMKKKKSAFRRTLRGVLIGVGALYLGKFVLHTVRSATELPRHQHAPAASAPAHSSLEDLDDEADERDEEAVDAPGVQVRGSHVNVGGLVEVDGNGDVRVGPKANPIVQVRGTKAEKFQLTLSARPKTARWFIDGEELCPRSHCRKNVPVGPHVFRVEAPGFVARENRVDVRDETKLSIDLERAP